MHKSAVKQRTAIVVLILGLIATACSSTTQIGNPVADLVEPTASVEQDASLPTPLPLPEPTDQAAQPAPATPAPDAPVVFKTGAQVMLQTPERFAGLRVGLIANQASHVNGTPLIDLLHEHPDFNLVSVFAPEHGIRGDLGAGELVPDGIDAATGVTVHSLYGESRVPSADMLEDLDVIFYDLQDVGARYYTFISTLGLTMLAAANADVAFVVLDRPLPSQNTSSAGFVLDVEQSSFVGAYTIPSTYALTAAELALAIKHQPFVSGLDQLNLSVFPVTAWQPGMPWPADHQWIPPSPGLPSLDTAHTYPATVLFEATGLSYGRGTDLPFGQIGAPWLDADRLVNELSVRGLGGVTFEATSFTPTASATATNPQFLGQTIPAVRLNVTDPAAFSATDVGVHLLEAVKQQTDEQGLDLIERPDFFDLLAGTAMLRELLQSGEPAHAIVQAWVAETASFDEAMEPWLLYPRPF